LACGTTESIGVLLTLLRNLAINGVTDHQCTPCLSTIGLLDLNNSAEIILSIRRRLNPWRNVDLIHF
jgi:hypothetical protein